MKYENILPYAIELCTELQPYCNIIKIGGSIRRKVTDDIKDIEIICIPNKFYLEEHLNYMKYSGKIRFIKNGALYKQFKWHSQTIDLFTANKNNFGWCYFYRTGSKEFNARFLHNYKLHNKIPAHLKGSDDGYLRDAAGAKVFTPEEKDVFDLAGWNFIEPQYRDK